MASSASLNALIPGPFLRQRVWMRSAKAASSFGLPRWSSVRHSCPAIALARTCESPYSGPLRFLSLRGRQPSFAMISRTTSTFIVSPAITRNLRAALRLELFEPRQITGLHAGVFIARHCQMVIRVNAVSSRKLWAPLAAKCFVES